MPKFLLYPLLTGRLCPIDRMKKYFQAHFSIVNEHSLTKSLMEIALLQDIELSGASFFVLALPDIRSNNRMFEIEYRT